MSLPEGFEVVSIPSTKPLKQSALPKGFEVVSTPSPPAKKSFIARAIDAVDNFAKDPIGNIIGKHEPHEVPQPIKPKPAPVQQEKIQEPKVKGTTLWDNLMESEKKIDTHFIISDPKQIRAAIDTDKQTKQAKEDARNKLLGDAPLEDQTLNLAFIQAGATRAMQGVTKMLVGKVTKSAEVVKDGASMFANGTGFAVGDAAGQVGAVTGMEGADALMSDDFKKNHETAAELIKAGTGLVLGGVAGVKAQHRVEFNPKTNPSLSIVGEVKTPLKETIISPEHDEAIASAMNKEYAPSHIEEPKLHTENPPKDLADDINVTPKVEEVNPRIAEAKAAQGERVRLAHEEAMARKAQSEAEQAHKADVETISSHPRLQELIDMRRDVSAKDSARPNIRNADRQIIHENNGNGYETTVIPAMDSKNYNHDFALTKADIKAYEKNGITPSLAEKLKKDLEVLDNDPLWQKVDENPSADFPIDKDGNPLDADGNQLFVRGADNVAVGMIAGIDEDENGNITFDPEKFVIGLGGYTAVKALAKNPTVQKELREYAQRALNELDTKPHGQYFTGEIPLFAGERARGADTDILAKAKTAIDNGEDAKAVWKDTGWIKDKDGKWKFEIDDSQAVMKVPAKVKHSANEMDKYLTMMKSDPENPNVIEAYNDAKANYMRDLNGGEYTLSDILDHDQLYRNYPTMKEMRVVFDDTMTHGGSYNPKNGTITLPTDHLIFPDISPLLHEIQHGVQGVEKFATGGSYQTVTPKQLSETLEKQYGYLPSYQKLDEEFLAGKIPSEEELYIKKVNLGMNSYGGIDKLKYDTYKRLHGETEARNVQSRIDMDNTARREAFPHDTMDVNVKDTNVRFDKESSDMSEDMRKRYMSGDRVNIDKLKSDADQLPQPIATFKDFRKQFIVDKDGNTVVDSKNGVSVSFNVRGAFKHFEPSSNTHYDDRTILSGAFLPTLKEPLAIVKQLHNNREVIFYRPFIDEKNNIYNLAAIKFTDGKFTYFNLTEIENSAVGIQKVKAIIEGTGGNELYFKHGGKGTLNEHTASIDDVAQSSNTESVLQNGSDVKSEGGFYHKMDQILQEKMTARATPETIMGVLRNNGIKDDEIVWSKIESILKNELGEDGKIAKSDLMEAINEMRPRFENVSYGKEYQQYSTRKTHGDTGAPENYNVNVTTVEKTGEKYSDSHWKNTSNELLHTRTDDAMIDGQKTLLVEEIQSTRHQAGRKEGYGKDAIAAAPLSKTWHELGMRQIIDEAVQKGYDRVAWVNGVTHGERSGLAQDIDKLVYNKDMGIVAGYKEGEEVFYRSITDEELDAMLGKDISRNLRSHEIAPNIHAIEGELLKVGGEGLKGFYDKILVDYAKKYTKKWGTTVEKKALPNGTEVHTFPVTQKMREDVSKNGQALYANGIGAMAGIETDENGNIIGFDPVKALVGVAGGSILLSKSVRNQVSKLVGKTEHLSDSAIQGLVRTAIKTADIATAGSLTKVANTLKESAIVDYVIGHKIYKLKDYMKLREDALRASNAGMEQAARLHLQLTELSSEAREAMYAYMSGEKNVALTPELKRAADTFVTKIDDMGQKMVDEGFLSKEAYEEWQGQYLHRRYASKIKQASDWASGKGEFAVDKVQMRGKQWKGSADEFDELQASGMIGKVSEGKVEATKTSDGSYHFRRDWTKEERTSMGEIRDIAYSLPETVGRLAQMTEFGKMLKAVPKKYLLDQGSRSDVVMRQLGYEKLTGSRYGALNGQWVNSSIAGDLKRVSNDVLGEEQNVKKLWNDYVSAVKMTHTIYNPTAHVNNIGSNIFLQGAAGLNPLKAIKYATDGTLASRRYGRWKELDAKRVTGLGADESAELSKIEADADVQLWKSLDERKMFGRSQLNEILRTYMSPSIDTKAGSMVHKASEAAKAFYQGEDDVMRFAAVKQLTKDGIWTQADKGMTQKVMGIDEAMKHANDHIIPDYSKPMSKLALTLRDSGLVPFMSWTYYSTPILLSQLRNHPTRVLAIAAAWYGMDRLMGVDPYNDETMPKGFDAQRVAIARDGNKVTGMRVSSMIPHIQLAQPENTYLEPLTSGIPQTILGAATNYNFYFRKPITMKEGGEGAYQRAKYAVQNVLPTPDVLDKAYNIVESKVLDKETRRTDRVIEPRTTAQEAASFFVNLQTYDVSKQREKVRKEKIHDKKTSDKWDKKVDKAMNKLQRVFQ